MPRAIIVHGWSDSPAGSWFPWLTRELEARGFAVTVPAMPDPDAPKIEAWVAKLQETIGTPDDNLVLVGHSVGCQTILRYLESLPEDTRVGRVVLVAPWFTLQNLGEDEKEVAKPWLTSPMDLAKVRTRAASFAAIVSDNDPYVPMEPTATILRGTLGATVAVEAGKGHVSGEDGVTELPSILSAAIG
ncbi:MAG: alpha/beta fold hydrolase [bacterium]|nr:alpha/beta fold hydrolase [bacterium]